VTDEAYRDPNASPAVVVGVVFTLVLVIVIAALQWYFYRTQQAELQRKVAAQAPDEVTRLQAQQEGQLNSYRWIDRKKDIVGIPIDLAMQLVVQEGDRPATMPATTTAMTSVAATAPAAPTTSTMTTAPTQPAGGP